MDNYIIKKISIIFIIFICAIFAFFVIKIKIGNKQLIDLKNTYDKCIIYIGSEKIELAVKSWKDYDGEQIQIIDEDGNVYLVSMNNAILIKEK